MTEKKGKGKVVKMKLAVVEIDGQEREVWVPVDQAPDFSDWRSCLRKVTGRHRQNRHTAVSVK